MAAGPRARLMTRAGAHARRPPTRRATSASGKRVHRRHPSRPHPPARGAGRGSCPRPSTGGEGCARRNHFVRHGMPVTMIAVASPSGGGPICTRPWRSGSYQWTPSASPVTPCAATYSSSGNRPPAEREVRKKNRRPSLLHRSTAAERYSRRAICAVARGDDGRPARASVAAVAGDGTCPRQRLAGGLRRSIEPRAGRSADGSARSRCRPEDGQPGPARAPGTYMYELSLSGAGQRCARPGSACLSSIAGLYQWAWRLRMPLSSVRHHTGWYGCGLPARPRCDSR